MRRFLLKLLFVPHEKNNHKALLIQPGFLALFIAFYLFNQSIITSLTIARPGILGYSSEITAQKVVELTNQQRRSLGLSDLSLNPLLSNSAILKANDMISNDYWAHNSPSGTTPWEFFRLVGYRYSVAGENLAKDFYDTDSMVSAWMKSPTHRDNIVNPKYQEIGIGVVNGVLNGVKTTLVVQHFGTPLSGQSVPKSKTPAIVPSQDLLPVAGAENTLDQPVLAITPQPETSPQPLLSPLMLSKIIGSLMFIIIIGVLFIDGYLTVKNNTRRLSGSAAGHIGFLTIIFILMLFSQSGSIF